MEDEVNAKATMAGSKCQALYIDNRDDTYSFLAIGPPFGSSPALVEEYFGSVHMQNILTKQCRIQLKSKLHTRSAWTQETVPKIMERPPGPGL